VSPAAAAITPLGRATRAPASGQRLVADQGIGGGPPVWVAAKRGTMTLGELRILQKTVITFAP